MRSNTYCPSCKRWYVTEKGGNIECSKCSTVNSKDMERIKKTLQGVYDVLESQGTTKYYAEYIANILRTPKLIHKYKKCNVTEMLAILEFKRQGWKIEYQHIDREYGYRYDFFIPKARIAIEIDEKYHESSKQKAKDIERDATLLRSYIKVLRIPEQTIRGKVSNVSQIVIKYIQKECITKTYKEIIEMLNTGR